MAIDLASETKFGLMSRIDSADLGKQTAEFAEEHGYASVWVGDHLAFAVPVLDPLLQLSQIVAHSKTVAVGTSVYLLPLRHPTPVAKQVATLDRMADGRFIFGVGVGGEFPNEFAAAGVPVNERGARLTEGMTVLRKLWSGEAVAHEGRHFSFPEVQMLPPPVQPGGPPIWCGGRSAAALRRAGRMADGYISYVVTPDMFRESLTSIEAAAAEAGRDLKGFGTGHLLFFRIDDDVDTAYSVANDHLTNRYAMDFSRATKKYAATGRPEDVAAMMREFHAAGIRYFVLDHVGPPEQRLEQLARWAREVRPLLEDLTEAI